MSKINIIEISGVSNHFLALSNEGRIFGVGSNIDHKLGLGYDIGYIEIFTENTTKYKINHVYAGWNHTLFQTEEGKVFACGDHNHIEKIIDKDAKSMIYGPSETIIKSGACFCISDFHETVIFIGFNPEMSPNKTVKYEVKIGLFGCNKKSKIAQIFTHNTNNESSFNYNNDYKYSISIEMVKSKLKLNIVLFDESKYILKLE